MKHLVRIIALLVGLLLIISGLIKINDPVGTAIKLDEYFEVFATDFGSFFLAFRPLALFLSILLSTLEIVLGLALIIRWQVKAVLIALLAMMVFFTFLTFYSAYFNKVTDCGCFGDALKLTPWTSFTKDVVLTTLLLVLFFNRRYLQPLVALRTGTIVIGLLLLACISLGLFTYWHLPFIDFRAYKVGNDLPALMKPSAPLKYKYIMEKDGQQKEFDTYPTDTTWKFKQMVVTNPEAQPKITDYSVWNSDGDYTQQTFEGNKLLIIVQDPDKADQHAFADINQLVAALEKAKTVTSIVLTSSDPARFDAFRHEVQLAVPYYFADATVLKTMIRANPGLMLLRQGKVMGQWHYHDVPTADEVLSLVKADS